MVAPATFTATDAVMAECRMRGVSLYVEGDWLQFTPASRVDGELLKRLRHLKAEIISKLTAPKMRQSPMSMWTPNEWCSYGHPNGWRSIFGSHVICATCHPPVNERVVAERLSIETQKTSSA